MLFSGVIINQENIEVLKQNMQYTKKSEITNIMKNICISIRTKILVLLIIKTLFVINYLGSLRL